MITRRLFLARAAPFLAAPAIVKASSLMSIKAWGEIRVLCTEAPDLGWSYIDPEITAASVDGNLVSAVQFMTNLRAQIREDIIRITGVEFGERSDRPAPGGRGYAGARLAGHNL